MCILYMYIVYSLYSYPCLYMYIIMYMFKCFILCLSFTGHHLLSTIVFCIENIEFLNTGLVKECVPCVLVGRPDLSCL